jgi:transcriptional regulator with XRE-family HTH domain
MFGSVNVKRKSEPVDKHVGSRVRVRRLMLDMTQTELADLIGITFQQVQKYEKGTNRISAGRLQRIAQVLQVPISYFFENIPISGAQSTAGAAVSELLESAATTDTLALIDAYTKIGAPNVRRYIVCLVEEIAAAQPGPRPKKWSRLPHPPDRIHKSGTPHDKK